MPIAAYYRKQGAWGYVSWGFVQAEGLGGLGLGAMLAGGRGA